MVRFLDNWIFGRLEREISGLVDDLIFRKTYPTKKQGCLMATLLYF
jgi:hypothetical protein